MTWLAYALAGSAVGWWVVPSVMVGPGADPGIGHFLSSPTTCLRLVGQHYAAGVDSLDAVEPMGALASVWSWARWGCSLPATLAAGNLRSAEPMPIMCVDNERNNVALRL